MNLLKFFQRDKIENGQRAPQANLESLSSDYQVEIPSNNSDKQHSQPFDSSPQEQGRSGESSDQKQEEGKYNSISNEQQHGYLSLQVLEKIEEFENRKPMQEWSVEEVCMWLDSMELGNYKVQFSKHQVTGQTLLGLDDNDLKQELGIVILGHRKKIQQCILEEKKKHSMKFLKKREEDKKGSLNSIDGRFRNLFSYMEKIDEEEHEVQENNNSDSSSGLHHNHKKKKFKEQLNSPDKTSSSQESSSSSDNKSTKLKRTKSKKSKKARKPTFDIQKSGDSADDESKQQQIISPLQSPNRKISTNLSDQKVEIFQLNEIGLDVQVEKSITQDISLQQSLIKQENSESVSAKSPPQQCDQEIQPILERVPSMNLQQLSRQKSELNQKMFDLDSSSKESDVSGNDTSSDSSEDEKIKNQKKIKKSTIKESKNNKTDVHQHQIPKKLLGMLKEFGINERVLIVFNELIIGQVIGEGGYGVVHKGKWLGQDVAIKSYGKRKLQGKLKYKLQMADFLKEVEVISNLRHPNIVLYMGVCIKKQNYYLITEYLEEGSLFDHLHKKKTHIDQKSIMQIVEDIALGMNYLHGRKVLHCDLKSSNVLIDRNWNVKLCDFGLSRINKKIEHKKVKGARIGTPHWMAPEIMRGEPYQEKADVYSFGMILWEIITQQIPYDGLSQTQIIGSVGYGQDQVPIPTCSSPSILAHLVKKCLIKNPEERPKFVDIVNEIQLGQKSKSKLKKQVTKQLFDFFD